MNANNLYMSKCKEYNVFDVHFAAHWAFHSALLFTRGRTRYRPCGVTRVGTQLHVSYYLSRLRLLHGLRFTDYGYVTPRINWLATATGKHIDALLRQIFYAVHLFKVTNTAADYFYDPSWCQRYFLDSNKIFLKFKCRGINFPRIEQRLIDCIALNW